MNQDIIQWFENKFDKPDITFRFSKFENEFLLDDDLLWVYVHKDFKDYSEFENKTKDPEFLMNLLRKHCQGQKAESKDNVDWGMISIWAITDILYEFEDRINWYHVSENENLPDDLIRKHYNKLYWDKISEWCSSSIVEEFTIKDGNKARDSKIVFYYVSDNPNLSVEFIKSNKDKLRYTQNILDILKLSN